MPAPLAANVHLIIGDDTPGTSITMPAAAKIIATSRAQLFNRHNPQPIRAAAIPASSAM